MLDVTITPHREFLAADTPGQKLFVMLKLRPNAIVSASRPSTTFTFGTSTIFSTSTISFLITGFSMIFSTSTNLTVSTGLSTIFSTSFRTSFSMILGTSMPYFTAKFQIFWSNSAQLLFYSRYISRRHNSQN